MIANALCTLVLIVMLVGLNTPWVFICLPVFLLTLFIEVSELSSLFKRSKPVDKFPVGSVVFVMGNTKTKHHLVLGAPYRVIDHYSDEEVTVKWREKYFQHVHVDDIEILN